MTTPDPKQDTSLALPDPTKLADWLPILQLPGVGERVCNAAGIFWNRVNGVCYLADLNDTQYRDETLDPHVTAALAFGGLSVLAESPPGGYDGIEVRRTGDEFVVEVSEWVSKGWEISRVASVPAAVLAALYRVYGPFGDGG